MRVVALTGRAGSGKSTAAAYLEERHGFVRTRFAGPLKAMLRTLYEAAQVLTRDEIERRIEGDLKEVPDPLLRGKTPRQAMQFLGTEWGRDLIGTDFWTELWKSRLANGINYVVEDCRFPNEAEAVRSVGGVIIEIECPWAGSATGAAHASENGGLETDFTVGNYVRGNPDVMFLDLEEALGL